MTNNITDPFEEIDYKKYTAESLNDKQKKSYDIITKHCKAIVDANDKAEERPKQLLMILQGIFIFSLKFLLEPLTLFVPL